MQQAKRIGRWLGFTLGGLLGAAALALAAAYVLVQSEAGRSWLARKVEAALSTPGEMELAIGRLDGGLPRSVRMSEVAVSDADGPWLEAGLVSIDWRPLELLAGRLQVSALEIDDLEISRWPLERPETQDRPPEFTLPSLPVHLAIERLSVPRISLGPEVLGVPAAFRIEGEAATQSADTLRVSLVLDRTDGAAGRAEVQARYRSADRRLALELRVAEPAGGLIARALEIPDLPALTARLGGDGPVDEWHGRMDADLEGLASLEAELGFTSETATKFRIAGKAETKGSPTGLPWQLAAGTSRFLLEGAWRPPGTLVLDRGEFDGPAAHIEASGELDTEGPRLDLSVRGGLTDPGLLAELLDGGEVRALSFEATAAGHPMQPEIRLDTTLERFAAPGLEAGKVSAGLTFKPDRPFGQGPLQGALSGTGRFEELTFADAVELEALIGRGFAWRLEGRLDFGQSHLEARHLSIDADHTALSGSGGFAFDQGTVDGDLRIDLESLKGLGPLLGIDVEGKARVTGHLEAKDFGRVLHATLAGELREVALEEPVAQSLLGGGSSVAADLSLGPKGDFRIANIVIESARARLSGEADFVDGFQRMSADYRLTVDDAGVLSAALGAALAGAARIEGRAEGPTENPRLSGTLSIVDSSIEGLDLGRLQVAYSIEDLPGTPRGHLEGTAAAPGGGLTGRGDYVFDGPVLRLSALRLGAEGATVEGAASLPLDGRPIEAELTGRTDDLGPWLALAGASGRGGAEARLRLSAAGGAQAARLDAEFKDVSLRLGAGEDLRIAKSHARIESDDLFADKDSRATVTAKDVRLGGLKLADLSLEGTGGTSGGTVTLSAAGRWIEDLSINATGRISLEEQTVALELTRLDGEALGRAVMLLGPARIARGAEIFEVRGLEVDFGGARLIADTRLGAGRLVANLQASDVPIGLFEPLWPTADMTGHLSGQIRVDGPLANPTGTAALELAELRFGTLTGESPFMVSLDGDWRDGRLALDGRLAGLQAREAMLSADVPLSLEPDSLALVVAPDKTLSGRLAWSGRIGEIWPLLPFPDHRLDGLADLKLEIDGTLNRPRTAGQLVLSGGEYESLETGTLLKDLELKIDLDGQQVILTSLSAKDGGSGRLTAKGQLDLVPDRDFPFWLDAELKKFALLRRDDVTGSAGGHLALEGSFAAAKLSGQLKTQEVQIRILDQLPPEVVDLEVIEVHGAAGTNPAGGKVQAGKAKFDLGLDLAVDMPRRVFVRGRGLDSEWAGKFEVAGTLDQPVIVGKLELVRGQLSVVGKVFKLKSGSVSFTDKEKIDPRLDVVAVNQSADLTVTARVSGPATNPAIEISSDPDLPQDEVISRVLFGKNTSQLAAFEAVQLAAAVAELSGTNTGAGGVLDFARGALGVDVLRIETVGTAGEEQPALSAGKYVTDEIFLGVKQGVKSDSGSVAVEIEITPNISIESGVGQTGEGNVGIKFKWDY